MSPLAAAGFGGGGAGAGGVSGGGVVGSGGLQLGPGPGGLLPSTQPSPPGLGLLGGTAGVGAGGGVPASQPQLVRGLAPRRWEGV